MINILSGLKLGGNTLDVASLVSQLMQAEQTKTQTLEAQKKTIQTRLGAFDSYKSSVQSLVDALKGWTDPMAVAGWSIQTSGSAQVSAQAESPSQALQWTLRVTQRASIAHVNLTQMGVYRFSSGGKTIESPSNLSDLQALSDWFNGQSQALGGAFRASVVTDASGQKVLTVQGLQSGADHDLSVVRDPQGAAQTIEPYSRAQDAKFQINGVSYSASNNSPLVQGVRLNLLQVSTSDSDVQRLELSPKPADTTKLRQTLADAYNAFHAEVINDTLPDVTGVRPAVLRDQWVAKSALRAIRDILDQGFTDASGKPWSLADLGLSFSETGAMTLTTPNANSWPTSALTPGKSAEPFSAWREGILGTNGWMAQGVQAEQDRLTRVADQETREGERLARLQQSYMTQFSALNATLGKLNAINESVKSAIAGFNKSGN